jgi:uncharacterized protein YjaG (DUF416 family)
MPTTFLQFDPESLSRRLERLSVRAQLAFGILLLERATPNFFRFQAETGAEDGGMIRGAQAKLWSLLERSDGGKLFTGITADACGRCAPDTEQYDSLYTSAALDAVSIACNVLDYAKLEKTELLVEAASLRRDSIDMFLQFVEKIEPNDSDFEARLLTHHLMQEELHFQEADLIFMEKWPFTETEAWSTVLGRSIELGYSSLRMITPIT